MKTTCYLAHGGRDQRGQTRQKSILIGFLLSTQGKSTLERVQTDRRAPTAQSLLFSLLQQGKPAKNGKVMQTVERLPERATMPQNSYYFCISGHNSPKAGEV